MATSAFRSTTKRTPLRNPLLRPLMTPLLPIDYFLLKSYVVEESDEEIEDKEGPQAEPEEEEEEDEIIESDIEIEGETVEPDNDPPQKMGDPSVEVTEENREASQEAKFKVMGAISEGIRMNVLDKHGDAREEVEMEIKENVSYLMLDFVINSFKDCIQHCRKWMDKEVAYSFKEAILLLEELHGYEENLREAKLEMKRFVAKKIEEIRKRRMEKE
ncbi:hsc70-interacting protein [Manihot esculenta]|nr:hsc70-interacting protein [Manihot esculenta]